MAQASDHPMSLATMRAKMANHRQRLVSSFRRRPHVDRLLAGLTRVCDQTLQGLMAVCPLPQGASLAALGGYGRAEMYPHSDVDVLILLADEPDDVATRQIEQWVAAMWDVGLEVAHSVRTVSQCVSAAAHDITLQTALLEARWLAGCKTRFQQLLDTLWCELDSQAFFRAKQAEMAARHEHYHHAAYALEPNCKASPGALRDLQLLLWVAQAAGYGSQWTDIVRSGALSPQEFRALRRAWRAFQRLRIELHLLAGRREDRLLFQYQPALARIYGLQDKPMQTASEQLMQRYYWAARRVRQLTVVLMQTIEETLFPSSMPARALDDNFRLVDGRLDIYHEKAIERRPSLIFDACLISQQQPQLRGMSARLLRAIWHARQRVDADFRLNPDHRQRFLRILQQPMGVSHALNLLNAFNILPRYIPAFRRIVGQMQHDLFHVYTVDEHTLKVVHNLSGFHQAEHAVANPVAHRLATDFDSPWLLYVAALFHDIAKGQGGDHARRGAAYARRFAVDHGLADADTNLIEFLVTHHLHMSHTAQKRDLSDPDVIRDFVALVGCKRYLDGLYLLTVADIRATRPNLWNAWKSRLLDDLYQRTLAMLDGTLSDAQAVMTERKRQARCTVMDQGVSNNQLDALWRELDDTYFRRHEAHDLVWHAQQLVNQLHATKPIVRARTIGQNEAIQVMVWVTDQPDLFARICRYFDQASLSIQEARIHTTTHGYALDSFIAVSHQSGRAYDKLVTTLPACLTHFLTSPSASMPKPCSVNHAPYQHSRRRQAQVFPISPQLSLERLATPQQWRLSVTGTDRPGLLHDLADVFKAHQIDLKIAKVHTLGQRIEDSFILHSQGLEHPATRQAFERATLAVLSHMPEPLPGQPCL